MTHTNDARTDRNRIASALSPAALLALSTLEDVGYEAWVVGGFVRDALRGVPCSDVDIASSAHWQEAQACFRDAGFKTRETGTKHGTLTVIIQGEAFEVTTFRTDGSYSDNRRPDSVSFVSNIQEDLKRRDFTINAMAFHPQRGLIDPFHGQEDLEAGIIRAVGNPDQRFREDGLRILRACRFASQLGFQGEAAETFLATVARYNELCEKGQDEDFGKAAEKMHPLTTGPFRAITYDTLKHTSVDDVSCMRLLVTMGGLVTDDCARVLDDASSPIPGLYAVGNTQGGRFVDDYPFSLSGASHGAALTYGYLAGKQIALD